MQSGEEKACGRHGRRVLENDGQNSGMFMLRSTKKHGLIKSFTALLLQIADPSSKYEASLRTSLLSHAPGSSAVTLSIDVLATAMLA